MKSVVPHNRKALLGAAFLMATSAIGPGFITQTAFFTEKLLASFGFVILCSIAIDVIVQLNIWRIISVTGRPAQSIGNTVLPGSGHALSFMIVIGGLAFNIGNMGGAALAFQLLFDWPLDLGAAAAFVIILAIFLVREAGTAIDIVTKVLGVGMIAMMVYTAITSQPPVKEMLIHSVMPEAFDVTAIMTLVGGTVGGYISFSGAHRLLAAGISGKGNLSRVSASSVKGILIAGVMRMLLFAAAFGVVSAGVHLDPGNPAATVFQSATGEWGGYFFGIVLLFASLTSILGSAFTSFSFLETYHPSIAQKRLTFMMVFLSISLVVLIIVGKPVSILIIVGTLNAFVLPLGLSLMLLASRNRRLVGEYRHSNLLTILGWIVCVILLTMSLWALRG